MAFVVRIRCQVTVKSALQGQPRWRRHEVFDVNSQKIGEILKPGAPWTDEEIRAIANRYADRQLSTLERDTQIIACMGFRHSAVEG
jgi:hypothetical protein